MHSELLTLLRINKRMFRVQRILNLLRHLNLLLIKPHDFSMRLVLLHQLEKVLEGGSRLVCDSSMGQRHKPPVQRNATLVLSGSASAASLNVLLAHKHASTA